MVLALSDEEPEKVRKFVEGNGYSVRSAAGSSSNRAYGVSGIPASVLIDPKGTIVWRGHPASLSDGKIKEALKGARKPGKRAFLELESALASSDALAGALAAARAGKLASAEAQARKIADDPALAASDRKAASDLAAEIQAHAQLVRKQANAALERLDVAAALTILQALADEFGAQALGKEAAEQVAAIGKDEKLQAELEANEALDKARRTAEKLSTSKARKIYQDFAEKHAGTRAGERAKALAKNL